MIFLFNDSTDAAFNLALEELLPSFFQDDIIMLWRNRSAVIVGRNQNTASEIDAAFVRDNNIQVIRRMTGGGAVYHDLGNINYTIVVRDRQLSPESFSANAAPVLKSLRELGIPAEFSGRNDILADGRKISGSAKTVLTDRTLFHGTLLFSADLEMLGKVLTPDPEKIRAKGIKSVRSRVANLQEFLPELSVDEFINVLKDQLLRHTGAVDSVLLPELISAAEDLADTKYRTWMWNYGTVMNYSYSKKLRFNFGSCQISFNVVENKITDFALTGDFFGAEPAENMAGYFNGIAPDFETVSQVAKKIPVENFIHGAKAEDLLLLFDL